MLEMDIELVCILNRTPVLTLSDEIVIVETPTETICVALTTRPLEIVIVAVEGCRARPPPPPPPHPARTVGDVQVSHRHA